MSETEDIECPSNCEADDEGYEEDNPQQLDFLGSQVQQPDYPRIPKQIVSPNEASESEQSTISYNDFLSLPWHGYGVPNQQVIHTSSVISNSKWRKLAMVKSCKAFGVNATGFEHELLDMILRMDQ